MERVGEGVVFDRRRRVRSSRISNDRTKSYPLSNITYSTSLRLTRKGRKYIDANLPAFFVSIGLRQNVREREHHHAFIYLFLTWWDYRCFGKRASKAQLPWKRKHDELIDFLMLSIAPNNFPPYLMTSAFKDRKTHRTGFHCFRWQLTKEKATNLSHGLDKLALIAQIVSRAVV